MIIYTDTDMKYLVKFFRQFQALGVSFVNPTEKMAQYNMQNWHYDN